MDDMEDDARYPPKSSFPLNRQNPSSHRHKHPIRAPPFNHNTRPTTRYEEQDDDDDEEPEEFDGYENDAVEDDDEDDEEGQNGYFNEAAAGGGGGGGFNPKKKRKGVRGSPVPNYEFAPRVKFPYNEDWSEHATFVLLEVWGDKFLQLGRTSLRSEDWHDVAEKVSEELKVERTVAQCKSVLDKLKRRYKKEKSKVEEMGLGSCKWAFFKKMDMLMASSPRQEYGLACGVDGGEYVFMNTRVYLNRSNGFDEMRDSPGESESSEDDDMDGAAMARKGRSGGRGRVGGGGGFGHSEGGDENEEGSFRVLADSIQRFGKIYEKIENSKRQQMMELEKMRLDFNRELELQKKQILERAQAEIAKIQEVDEDEDEDETDDTSTDNLSE